MRSQILKPVFSPLLANPAIELLTLSPALWLPAYCHVFCCLDGKFTLDPTPSIADPATKKVHQDSALSRAAEDHSYRVFKT